MDKFLKEHPTYIGEDFAGPQRRAFLKSIPHPKKPRDFEIAPGVLASKVWGTDVSGCDRRSVKAQLRGCGDYRAAWWRFNSFMHRAFGRSQEQGMYSFHKWHHAITLARLKFERDLDECRQAILKRGLIAGLTVALEQTSREKKRDCDEKR